MWNIMLLLFVVYFCWFKSTCSTFTVELLTSFDTNVFFAWGCRNTLYFVKLWKLTYRQKNRETPQLTSQHKGPQTGTAGKGQTDINFSLRMNCNNFCTADFLIQLHQQAKLCLSYSAAWWYDKEFNNRSLLLLWKLKLWWNLQENDFTASCYILESTELHI